jgi:hypothetical protein
MKIQCPECKAISDEEEWRESEVSCEDCGSHPSRVCPKCFEHIDTVYKELSDYEVGK